MSDNVPEEVVADILLRLRVNDLIRCRRVSKQWLSIIDDPHFISRQLQLSISTNTNAALYLQDRRSPILFWKQRYASDINFFSTPIKYEPSEVSLMGSCHGLTITCLFCGVLKKWRKIGIWVLEEYGNPESWNRRYYIDYEGFFRSVTSVGSNGGKILLMLNGNKLSWYDPSKNEDGTILTHDVEWCHAVFKKARLSARLGVNKR
ncbi:hypothetical protein LINPERPRIM_LOCUS42499 [Linum perenne]